VYSPAPFQDRRSSLAFELIEKYEGRRPVHWAPDLASEFVDEELRAIVAFEIPIARTSRPRCVQLVQPPSRGFVVGVTPAATDPDFGNESLPGRV
jgi:hypothetical protein